MKLFIPEIDFLFDFKEESVCSLVIENQNYLYSIMIDVQNQLEGLDGNVIISEENVPISFKKNVELLDQFFPFSLNQSWLVSKAISELSKEAISDTHYYKTMELMSIIERYLLELSFDAKGDIVFQKINPETLIKAMGFGFRDDNYDKLTEKIIDYFELVTEYDRPKLFITYNLRSIISDVEASLFIDDVKKLGYNVLMVENSARNLLSDEKRYIIDESLCEIG